MLAISGFGLLLGATRANFVSAEQLVPYVAIGALLSLAMFFGAARKNPRVAATMVGLCVLSGLYGWGLAAAVNMAADPVAPHIYEAQVVGGHESHGRSTSYYLELGPWGPYTTSYSQIQVSRDAYEAMRPGEVVCVALHPGALQVGWYEMVGCGGA